jgi:hypothetical protein
LTRHSKFFEKRHKQFKALRNAIGGHFQFSAAQEAATHFEPDAIGKLEIKYHNSGQGGEPKLYYAGEVAAVAFTRHLLGNKPRSEKLSRVMQTANEAYYHATSSMHALILLFLWDRFA